MDLLARRGYRAIAHDRHDHGRSDRTRGSSDMDAHADDLAELLEALDLKAVVLVGHGAGGGEVARYIGRHGSSRVAEVVLVGAVTPLMIQTDANPDGTPLKVFDEMRADLPADRPQFFGELAERFYGANRPAADVPRGVLDAFRSRALAGNLEKQLGGIGAFSETDFTEDLKKFDVPTLIVHGDDDQIVPIVPTALRTSKLVKGSILKVYEGAPHGLPVTHAERFNADLLEFI